MPRDDDEAPDPRHQRSRTSSSVMIALALVVGFLLVVGVGGAASLWFVRARAIRKVEVDEAKLAAYEREMAAAGAEVAIDPDDRGKQLDPIPVELATITPEKAGALDGRLLLVKLDLLNNDDRRGEWVVYSNDGPDTDEASDIERAVWVPKELAIEPNGSARGRIYVVVRVAAVGADGTEFPEYTVIRVVLEP